MLKRHRVLMAAVLVLLGAAPVAAQEDGGLRLFVNGGLQTSPASYDSFRPVEYDAGFQLGGGFALQLNEVFAVRAEMAKGSNSGFEGGVLDEDVDFDRTYYGVSAELTLPLDLPVRPYGLLGGGLISISRFGPNYEYSFTESGGTVGAGIALPLGAIGAEAFAQAAGWIYSNSSTAEAQIDPILSVGLAYTIPF